MSFNNFIFGIIDKDIKDGIVGKNDVVVRFPPEPNGFLHLGHAKSIILHKEIVKKYNAKIRLRFDDTNPEKENIDFVNHIKKDFFWLLEKETEVVFASDYFDKMLDCAFYLIEKDLAYVDLSSLDDFNNDKGDFNKPNKESKYRSNSVDVNYYLFKKMVLGDYKEGEACLRLKIDLSSSNMNMRDPVAYRIKNIEHHRVGNKYKIYPTYDWAHPISDAIEKVTHSICTLEFEDHKPLYNWIVNNLFELLEHKPKQIEFAKLNLKSTVLSKRKLNYLVVNNLVSGWDDISMPTICSYRKKGFTPKMIEKFILKNGVSKTESFIEEDSLEEVVREELKKEAFVVSSIYNPSHLYLNNGDKLLVNSFDVKNNYDENFYRIAVNNYVRLKNYCNIFVVKVVSKNNCFDVYADIDETSFDYKTAKKAKTSINWLNENKIIKYEAVFLNNLFDENGVFSNKNKEIVMFYFSHDFIPNLGEYYLFDKVGYFYFDGVKFIKLCYVKDFFEKN